jgi:transcriptional regulator of acetoin/glycerol metabolism
VKAAALQRARDLLATGNEVDRSALPAQIADSWERCSPLYTRIGDRGTTISDADPHNSWQQILVDAAETPVAELAERLGDLVGGVVLSDPDGRLLRVRCPDPRGYAALEAISLLPGAAFGETSVGTNGIGTPLAAGRPVHVIGPQHLREEYRTYTCAGLPLLEPGTGRLLGALSIVGKGEQVADAGALMEAALEATAQGIDQELLTRSGGVRAPLLRMFNARGRAFAGPVLAFAPSLTICNSAASVLASEDLAELRRLATRTIRSGVTGAVTLPLVSGTLMRVQRTLLATEDHGTGVLFELEPAAAPVSWPAPGGPAAHARPRAHRPAARGLRSVAPGPARHRRGPRPGENVLVSGETGTGKTALALAAFRRVRPGTEPDLLEPDDLERRVRSRHLPLRPSGRPTVVRDIQHLSPAAAAALARMYSQRAPGVQLVATCVPDTMPDDSPAAGLLSLFAHTCPVPPLRRHLSDLPAIAADMLGTLSPIYPKRLSESAVTALSRGTWPGNLEQLHDVLAVAAGTPGPTIDADDLAPAVTNGRSLSMMERVERDAILRALYDADRNRSRAAVALGISRSTLYRRLATYGLTSL